MIPAGGTEWLTKAGDKVKKPIVQVYYDVDAEVAKEDPNWPLGEALRVELAEGGVVYIFDLVMVHQFYWPTTWPATSAKNFKWFEFFGSWLAIWINTFVICTIEI